MYRAKETFWAPGNRHIVKGDLIAPHDPVLEDREELFEAVVIPQAAAPAYQPSDTPQPSADDDQEPDEDDDQEPVDPDGEKPFDPAEHAAPQVLAYLETADLHEAERVLQAESDGKARTTILTPGGPLLARKEREQKEGAQ
ncbi:hypothetical protein [Streptomyces sp. NBC_00582]|uniref:hypothetical protein n=1 Tax=Streptomyces sp. NBC_00582 TaxID=2975783 RepID=UPI002E81974B|nr:hypothetical protein [Streptomyces sp. NBC_00582]WUB61536.1 hypothetical protein OG852_14610 [Streptomyces sp. NBC_00582]